MPFLFWTPTIGMPAAVNSVGVDPKSLSVPMVFAGTCQLLSRDRSELAWTTATDSGSVHVLPAFPVVK